MNFSVLLCYTMKHPSFAYGIWIFLRPFPGIWRGDSPLSQFEGMLRTLSVTLIHSGAFSRWRFDCVCVTLVQGAFYEVLSGGRQVCDFGCKGGQRREPKDLGNACHLI